MTLECQFLFTWSHMLKNSVEFEFCKGQGHILLVGTADCGHGVAGYGGVVVGGVCRVNLDKFG